MSPEAMAEAVKRALTPEEPKVDDTIKRARLDPELQPETAPTAPAETSTSKGDDELEAALSYPHKRPGNEVMPEVVSKLGLKPSLPVMPPSLELVTGVKADLRARKGFVGQEEVGIIGYAGDPDFKGVKGVIKQRYVAIIGGRFLLSMQVYRLPGQRGRSGRRGASPQTHRSASRRI